MKFHNVANLMIRSCFTTLVIYQKMKNLDLSPSRRIGYKKISAKCAGKNFPILDDLNLLRWYYWVNSL